MQRCRHNRLESSRERWHALSIADRQRPLVLVAHGPESDTEARLWIENLETAARGSALHLALTLLDLLTPA